MSEVIENYIRRNPGLSEKDAFDGFLKEDRIQSWVGKEESRKDRLRKEFGRTWGSMHADTAPSSTARSGPSGPTMQQPRSVHVDAPVRPQETPPAHVQVERRPLAPKGTPMATDSPHGAPSGAQAIGGGRRLQVMCTTCKRIEVWMGTDHEIKCRRCGTVYHDMLHLVRVHPVGPLAFYFGEGWKGPVTAAGILAGLVALYFLLRSV